MRIMDFSCDVYNKLATAEEAYGQATNPAVRFGAFLQDFARITERYGLSRKYGAFLLHRHFDAAQDCIPVENVERYGDRVSLVTRIRDVTSVSASYRASRWMFSAEGGDMYPLEYSTDVNFYAVEEDLAYLFEFGNILRRHSLVKYIGVSLLSRQSCSLSEDEVYFEETTSDASVVTVRPSGTDDEGRNSINTTWAVADIAGRCAVYNRCRATNRCRSDGSGRHSYQYGHDVERGHHWMA